MDLWRSDCCDDEPSEVEDPQSGQRYLMYPLRVTWPGAPCIVYECQACHGRFEAADWGGGCPSCTGAKPRGCRSEGC